MKVVFRADASPSIGGGHVMRCLALADVMTLEGNDCYFACSPETVASVPALSASGNRTISLSDPVGPGELMRKLPDGCDWLVVDHYGYDASFEKACRPWARNILVIDDLADRSHDCDLLLDQTLGRDASSYEGLLPANAEILVGSDYALLRREFAMARQASLEKRRSGELKHIVVSMGLTDPVNATWILLAGIRDSRLALTVDVVLGHAATHLSSIRSFVEQNPSMTLNIETTAMAELMRRADLCFGAAGSSAWERCCLGLPTVLAVTADNQTLIAEQLVKDGAALSLGPFGDVTPADVVAMLKSLAQDPQKLIGLSDASAGLCDGRGGQRVAMRLSPAMARDGRPVWLRSASADDRDLIYEWQCQPETRRFGRNSAIPSRDEHGAWFAVRLNSSSDFLNIIMHDGVPSGTLRLDRMTSGAYEISIVVSMSCYGQGLGLAALELARRLVPESEIKAEILEGNLRSEALFTRAGYKPEGYGWRSLDALFQNGRATSPVN